MSDRTLNPNDDARRLAVPFELEYLRDLIGYTPYRWSVNGQDQKKFYVDSGGDDSAIGDNPTEPWSTLQAAVDKIPLNHRKKVQINVGAGDFAGFKMGNVASPISPGLFQTVEILGTMQTPTLTSGATSGTAAGGGTDSEGRYTLTKPAAADNWVADELIGMRVRKTAGTGPDYAHIIDNTTTALTVATVYDDEANYDNTTVFVIEEYGTRIKDVEALSDQFISMTRWNGSIELRDLDLQPDDNTKRWLVANQGERLVVDRCRIKGKASANHVTPVEVTDVADAIFSDCYFDSPGGTTGGALYATYSKLTVQRCGFSALPTNVNAIEGLHLALGSRVHQCYVDANSAGLSAIVAQLSALAMSSIHIIGCASDAVILEHVKGYIKEVTGTTSNAAYGVRFKALAKVAVDASNTVTGSSGNYWIGELGSYTWATEMAAAKDSILDLYSGAHMVRVVL